MKPPKRVRYMAISQKARVLTLKSGEKVTGWTNYMDKTGRDMILADDSHRWVPENEITASAAVVEPKGDN